MPKRAGVLTPLRRRFLDIPFPIVSSALDVKNIVNIVSNNFRDSLIVFIRPTTVGVDTRVKRADSPDGGDAHDLRDTLAQERHAGDGQPSGYSLRQRGE